MLTFYSILFCVSITFASMRRPSILSFLQVFQLNSFIHFTSSHVYYMPCPALPCPAHPLWLYYPDNSLFKNLFIYYPLSGERAASILRVEDGGGTVLEAVGNDLPDCTTSYPKRQNSSSWEINYKVEAEIVDYFHLFILQFAWKQWTKWCKTLVKIIGGSPETETGFFQWTVHADLTLNAVM